MTRREEGPILRLLHRSGHKNLTDYEARIVEALADTIFPEDGPFAAGARTTGVVQYVDEYLDWIPQRERILIRCMFMLFEVDFAVFNPGVSNRFSAATPEERRRCLESWDRSSLYYRRSAFQALKGTILLAFLRHPDVQDQIGVRRGEVEIREHYEQMLARLDEAAEQATGEAPAEDPPAGDPGGVSPIPVVAEV